MLKILRLYTEPATITPIVFDVGVNVILGEKDDSSNKTNGVGKSLCVEFINFALLKQRGHSRVSRIPAAVFSHKTAICLDFEIHGESFTSKRTLDKSDNPIIVIDGQPRHFSKLEDASAFLSERLFSRDQGAPHPSFRAMLGPLIRDERSEFKSLIQCYDTKLRLAGDVEPHLYIFDLDLAVLRELKLRLSRLEEVNSDLRRIRENVRLLRGKDIKDAKADLNELKREVARINEGIDRLENTAGYDAVKADILGLEDEIDTLRREKGVLRHNLRRLKPIEVPVTLQSDEIVEFYRQLNSRLGEIVKHDLDEVLEFKKKIDEFQSSLLNDQKQKYSIRLKEVDRKLIDLDKRYKALIAVLDQGGGLRNLKQTYAALKQKSDELAQLSSFVGRFEDLDSEKKRLKSEKEADSLALQTRLAEKRYLVDEFESFLLAMHEYIQGNRKASFSIDIVSGKQVVDITLRIDDDGSYSVEREKVFMYDMSLLLSEPTRVRHPGMLVHDNLFNVDDDTLLKSFQWLAKRADFSFGQQYLITLNTDLLNRLNSDPELEEFLAGSVRATFTKGNRFLRAKYQEE